MAEERLTFTAYERSKLFQGAQAPAPRLGGRRSLTLTDTDTGQFKTRDAPFTFMAAADVAGLKPTAIKHMAPAPFARDAETTKLVHVDLWEPDLPWRYTPMLDAPDLRPWLVLLVGTAEEIKVEGGFATATTAVLQAHDLRRSHLWAHTQFDGRTTISRIVSPRGMASPAGLVPQHEHVAVLVPAFNDAGQPMWLPGGEEQFGDLPALPAFHSWRFWTAEAGDFETLATALKVPPARDVGKARLHYARRPSDDVEPIKGDLEVRGAITSIQQLESPDAEAIARIKADLDGLNDELDETIGLPQYGRPWVPDPDSIVTGWPNDIEDDPRFRGATGLGVWMGVEGQEALMDAAVAQAGALREAGQRVGHLALGLMASGSLWDRRVPTDKNERLRLFGPSMARMIAADGGVVLDRVTSGTSPLVPALFSSVAQRVLRDRSGATRHVSDGKGGFSVAAAFDAANRPERQPERAPAGLPHLDAVAGPLGLDPMERVFELDQELLDRIMADLRQAVGAFVKKFQRERENLIEAGRPDEIPGLAQGIGVAMSEELAAFLQELLGANNVPCEAVQIIRELEGQFGVEFQVMCASALDDPGARARLLDGLRREIRVCLARGCNQFFGQGQEGPSCREVIDAMPTEPPQVQVPIDLGGLSDAIIAILDPRKPDAPARVRVCSTLVGIDCSRLIPPEYPIGLDFPTWSLLKQYDKEWLLPGAGELVSDSVTALQTNPTFIDAFMVGINTQFMSEMRWRDLAVERTCTPLRMFWGQVDYSDQTRLPDIVPLAEWAKATAEPLGAPSHQSIQPPGSRLVLVFRTALFRRYPSTLVYLVKPAAGDDVDVLLKAPPVLDRPPADDPVAWQANRKYLGPIFAGTLEPDLTFFTFDVEPSTLDQYWLVLDEPPAELRFCNVPFPPTLPDPVILPVTEAASFAKWALDRPTRVAISGHELEQQALNP